MTSVSVNSHLVVFILCIVAIFNVDAIEDYTKEERVALNEFRSQVFDNLTREYQRVDGYLIRFLRAKDMDVNAAKKMIMETLKWRAYHKIDKILEETTIFDEMGYPESIDGFDKEGLPVLTVNIGKLDIRRLILEGKKDKLVRAYVKLGETMEWKAYEASNRTGSKISQSILIADYHGFNAKQHLCVQCILFAQEHVEISENNFPGSYKVNVLLNVPRLYYILFSRIESLQSAQTREVTKIFESDKNEWSAFLDKYIAPDQRTYQFGGTKGV